MYTAALFLALSVMCSFKLGRGVAVSLEGSVGNFGTVIVHERHHRLVHGTIPLNVARLSESVAVDILVRQMEHWVLASLPLTVGIRYRRVLGEYSGQIPVEQVRVVSESLHVDTVIVHNNGAVVGETTTESTDNKPADVEVSNPAPNVEVLDGELTNDSQTRLLCHWQCL